LISFCECDFFALADTVVDEGVLANTAEFLLDFEQTYLESPQVSLFSDLLQ
jgi:hypothetical protein